MYKMTDTKLMGKKIVENNSKINSHHTWKKKIPKQPKPKVQNYLHCRPKV